MGLHTHITLQEAKDMGFNHDLSSKTLTMSCPIEAGAFLYFPLMSDTPWVLSLGDISIPLHIISKEQLLQTLLSFGITEPVEDFPF